LLQIEVVQNWCQVVQQTEVCCKVHVYDDEE
jgi:hypothetical protein